MKLLSKLAAFAVAIIFVTLMLGGCAVSPRTSSWDAPARLSYNLSYKQVVAAVMGAGASQGMSIVSSDRETGNFSFSQNVADVVVVLNVSIKKIPENRIQVQTTVTTSAVAVAGIHEEFINKFHAGLFRSLGISSPAESNVTIRSL